MLIDLIKNSWKPLILIALVSLTITWAFNIQNTMLVKETNTITNVTYWHFSLQTYMQNINNSWESNALQFENILPTRTWDDTAGFLNWEGLFNNLAFLFDWCYFPFNFVLWLMRWGCWLIKILLAIIGWNTGIDDNGNYYSSLVNILTWVKDNMFIPYV